MSISKKARTDIEALAINIVDTERRNWEDAVCYVTDTVAFKMRQLIRVCRKNYWGVFDEPIDPNTKQEKIWWHLALKIVEDIVKNIDLDQKDINFIAKNPDGYQITEITRATVKDYLDRIYFGETLDESERQLCIDGTVVWKTWLEGDTVKRKTVDLLNFYIDPTEDSIQSAYRVTERAILTPDQLVSMKAWQNTDDIIGSQSLDKNDGQTGVGNATPTTGKFVDVWETWGKIPKYLITGKKADTDTDIDGHIVVSGLQSGDKRVHLIEVNNNKDAEDNIIKPYEECRAVKVTGRWYGLGFIERILALQEYLNMTMNMRTNRQRIAQLGLFKIKKGSGITPQMLANLPSSGAVSVNNMEDIGQMTVSPPDDSSYRDEEVVKEWASGVSQAYPASTGEPSPASASATAIAVESNASKSAYTMTQDAIGSFLERWIQRHLLPRLAKIMSKKDLLRITNDDDKFKAIAEKVVNFYTIESLNNSQELVTPEQLEAEMESAAEKVMKKDGLFFKLVQEIIAKNVDTKVFVTSEALNPNIMVRNIIDVLNLAPEYKEPLTKEIFNLMGLALPKLPKPQMVDTGMGIGTSTTKSAPTEQSTLTTATAQ